MDEDDPREELLRQLCDHRTQFSRVLVLCLAFAVVQVPYLAVVERGTALYAVSVVNMAGLVFFGGVSALVLWRCNKLRERQPF